MREFGSTDCHAAGAAARNKRLVLRDREPSDVLPGGSDPRFLGPGAPFGIWAGVVISDL
jgi:hypothetical protein